jgi:hypothetical protein
VIGTVTHQESPQLLRIEQEGGVVEIRLSPVRIFNGTQYVSSTQLSITVIPRWDGDPRWSYNVWASMPRQLASAVGERAAEQGSAQPASGLTPFTPEGATAIQFLARMPDTDHPLTWAATVALTVPPRPERAPAETAPSTWVVSAPDPGQRPPEPYDPFFGTPHWDFDWVPARQEWAAAADFAWAQTRPGDLEMVCIAAVRGRSPRDVLRILSPESVTEPMPAAQARAWAAAQVYPRYGTALEAGVLGAWTIVIEIGGYQAADQTQLAALSEGTAAVAVLWSPSGDTYLTCARDGRQVRHVETICDWSEIVMRGRRLVQEDGLPENTTGGRAAAFALLQRLTGVRITLDTILEPGDRIALGMSPG